MALSQDFRSSDWRRHFVYRRECYRTTWKFRLLSLLLLLLLVSALRPVWERKVADALTCDARERTADAVLIENFAPEYLLFEHVARLRNEGLTARVLVPAQASPDPGRPALLASELVVAMARVARLPSPEIIPVREVEPLSLNVARQVRDFLRREHVRSVIVVSPGFRSRRSSLIYQEVLNEVGIASSCEPVFGLEKPDEWFDSWHGRQRVVLELGKLAYYRAYVLPFLLKTSDTP